ncbi:MAG TPA: hypothetical protein PK620_03525 [Denitromonas sp.]|nr:hypothetical protein [Denitromonas sp.]HQU87658.1 hypothetical protein [Denitromonas sp.]HQV13963.1 hypothetical protein [Denitromonas sp.]
MGNRDEALVAQRQYLIGEQLLMNQPVPLVELVVELGRVNIWHTDHLAGIQTQIGLHRRCYQNVDLAAWSGIRAAFSEYGGLING